MLKLLYKYGLWFIRFSFDYDYMHHRCMMKIMLTREKCITRQSVLMNISMVAVPVVSVEIAYCSRSSKFTAAARPKLPLHSEIVYYFV